MVEMADHGRHSLCCGGGGGRMWQEEITGRRISEMRIQQAKQTGADTLATACPFCLQMFQDAVKGKSGEEGLQVKDIAELIIEAAE